MSSPYEVKAAARDTILGSPVFAADWSVTWGFTGRDPGRKWIWLGDLVWSGSEWVTNRSRECVVSLRVVANLIELRTTAEEIERTLTESVNEELERVFRVDPSLGGVAITSTLEARRMGSQPHADGGVEGQMEWDLTVKYRPTRR